MTRLSWGPRGTSLLPPPRALFRYSNNATINRRFLSASSVATPKQPRVHVLGLGSIGTFAAHSLAEVPPPLTPQVTLLLHRPSLVDQFRERGSKITLEERDGNIVDRSNFNLEFLENGKWHAVPLPTGAPPEPPTTVQDDIIDNLIVSVKGAHTVSALQPLRHRLNASSQVLFLQNGSGMIDKVNDQLFTDSKTRPNYITGVISHGVKVNSPFHITHTGFAATSLGSVPRPGLATESESAQTYPHYLMEALPLVPRFSAKFYPYLEVLQLQLEKISVNAFSNPLTALHDAPNKYLFTIPETRHALISEISQVIHALPELQGVAGVSERFAVEKLEATVVDIIRKNIDTTCSMVFDLRRGQKTEIQFINGYWSKRGREVGVPTPVNDDIVRRVLERQGDSELAKLYR